MIAGRNSELELRSLHRRGCAGLLGASTDAKFFLSRSAAHAHRGQRADAVGFRAAGVGTACSARHSPAIRLKPANQHDPARSMSHTSVQSEPAMEALAGLLNEFRHGNIVARSAEKQGMRRHAGPLSARWNQRFPGFPGKILSLHLVPGGILPQAS